MFPKLGTLYPASSEKTHFKEQKIRTSASETPFPHWGSPPASGWGWGDYTNSVQPILY